MVQPIPDGYSTVTPHIVCKNCSEAIEWYKKAFNAEEMFRMPGPDGQTIMHAEMKIGNSIVMLIDEFPMPGAGQSPLTLKGTSCSLNLYVEQCDKAFQQAIDAGATSLMPPTNMFWGDRMSKLQDPNGHHWCIMTHQEDVAPEEMGKRAAEVFKDIMGDGGS